MPPVYSVFHVLASVICFFAVLRAPARPKWTAGIALCTFAFVAVGFTIERRSDWAWSVLAWSISDLVYLTNFALEGSAVLLALLWKAAPDKKGRVRAGALGVPLAAVALSSYAWYFEPLPQGILGQSDATGMCRQSSDDSCSAASAVMLLRHYGIAATEAEMARLCLTRAGKGTTPLGLFHGLAVKARERSLRPKLIVVGRPDRLRELKGPVIIGVGLRAGAPAEVAERMEGYGWSYTARHSVLVEGAEADGKWVLVADPTNGRERWPTDDLRYLWDGTALGLGAK